MLRMIGVLEGTRHWHRNRLVRLGHWRHRHLSACGLRGGLGRPLRIVIKVVLGCSGHDGLLILELVNIRVLGVLRLHIGKRIE